MKERVLKTLQHYLATISDSIFFSTSKYFLTDNSQLFFFNYAVHIFFLFVLMEIFFQHIIALKERTKNQKSRIK
jgi:hypothetical protein